jgi:hypothetical protein
MVADCPRCGVKRISFEVAATHLVGIEGTWRRTFEAWAICRHCQRSTTFWLRQTSREETRLIEQHGVRGFKDSLNKHFSIEGYVSLKDQNARKPPDHLPLEISTVFAEGATCMAVECWNAAGVMFRLCVDLATESLLPPEDPPVGPNAKQRRDLGLRLPWLFDKGLLPLGLRDLSSCIHQDGNDGAHRGALRREDVEDLVDFTEALLERLYTEPERIRLAGERRAARRDAPAS